MSKENSKMPDRNEYIMFIDKNMDLSSDDTDDTQWCCEKFLEAALYAYKNNTYISYSHTVEYADSKDDMKGAVILVPEIIRNPALLICQLGLFKKCACLQVTPINTDEFTLKRRFGVDKFLRHFYPEDPEAEKIYLAERKRSVFRV